MKDSGSKTRRRAMRRKEVRKLLEEGADILGGSSPNVIEEMDLDNESLIYLFDGQPQLIRTAGALFPALTSPLIERLPSVVVDMGAVPFVCKGADVMAPGVEEVRGEFNRDGLVVIRDVRHLKALAVGRSLTSSEAMRGAEKGKVITNLHYVGDELWQAYSKL